MTRGQRNPPPDEPTRREAAVELIRQTDATRKLDQVGRLTHSDELNQNEAVRSYEAATERET